MTFGFVQKNAGASGDNITTGSFSDSLTGVTAGHLVVCTVTVSTATQALQAAAIPTPTGWTAGVRRAGASNSTVQAFMPSQAIFYKLSSGGGTETAAWSTAGGNGLDTAGTYIDTDISEFSYSGTCSADSPVGFFESTVGTATSMSTSGAANSSTSGLCIAVGSSDVNAMSNLVGPTSGFTQIFLVSDNSVHADHASGYKILSSSASQVASWSWTTANWCSAALMNFVDTAGATDDPWYLDQDMIFSDSRRGARA